MSRICQIGVVVEDVEKTAANIIEIFQLKKEVLFNRVGREFPLKYDCGTVYKGDDKSMASCITCCLEFDNVELELIQPYGEAPSEWRRFLDEKGEGIHHLGIKIENTEEVRKNFESRGCEEIQEGNWGEGEYHYFNAVKGLGFVVEGLKLYGETD